MQEQLLGINWAGLLERSGQRINVAEEGSNKGVLGHVNYLHDANHINHQWFSTWEAMGSI